ncbi:MAG: class I SAM-dependent methyltransferase [Nocardioidaceae bacterium]
MTSVLSRTFDAAFGHPRGLAGRAGGALMRRGNVEQERWAVRQAQLCRGDHVLVVGPGPGVGLAFAALAVAPEGHVTGVDPSDTMRRMAATRCAAQLRAGTVELRDGTAEKTGCADASMDVAVSVNNIMLWDRPAGLTELVRVLRPGGRLVVTVHRHVLRAAPEQLQAEMSAAGLVDVELNVRPRRRNSPAVEVLARTPG